MLLLLLLLLLLLFLSGKSSGIFKRHTCSLPLSFSLRNLTLRGFTQEEKESPWRSASRTFGIIFFSNWLMLPLGCEFNDQLTWSIYWISFYSVLFPPHFFSSLSVSFFNILRGFLRIRLQIGKIRPSFFVIFWICSRSAQLFDSLSDEIRFLRVKNLADYENFFVQIV